MTPTPPRIVATWSLGVLRLYFSKKFFKKISRSLKTVLCVREAPWTLWSGQPNMAAITYAYEALAGGYATPIQLYQVDLAQKALPELDRIRDLSDPVNRRKIRIIAENFARNYLADCDEEDLDEAIIHAYSGDNPETHAPLLKMVERLTTAPN